MNNQFKSVSVSYLYPEYLGIQKISGLPLIRETEVFYTLLLSTYIFGTGCDAETFGDFLDDGMDLY